MLARSTRHEIERLLADGRLSRREIARRLGVSRTVVQSIAAKTFRRRRSESRRTSFDNRPRQRCPSCGYLVPLPCVYCRANAYRAHRNVGFQHSRLE